MKTALITIFATLAIGAVVLLEGFGQNQVPAGRYFTITDNDQTFSTHYGTWHTNILLGKHTWTNIARYPVKIQSFGLVIAASKVNTINIDIIRQRETHAYRGDSIFTNPFGTIFTQFMSTITGSYFHAVSTNSVLAHTTTNVQSHIYTEGNNIAPLYALPKDVIEFKWTATNGGSAANSYSNGDWITFTLAR